VLDQNVLTLPRSGLAVNWKKPLLVKLRYEFPRERPLGSAAMAVRSLLESNRRDVTGEAERDVPDSGHGRRHAEIIRPADRQRDGL